MELGEPGDGPELALTEVPATTGAQREVRADPNPAVDQTGVNVTVTGTNGVDLAGVGANLKGAAGTEVTAQIGVHNVDEATLDLRAAAGSRPRSPRSMHRRVNKRTTTGGTGGGDGDDDGTLPITGPGVGGIAGTGLLMIALGVFALVATRRREAI